MTEKVQVSQLTLRFPKDITLLFIAAKLWGVVDWSWWSVTSPLWGSFLILAACIALQTVASAAGESE